MLVGIHKLELVSRPRSLVLKSTDDDDGDSSDSFDSASPPASFRLADFSFASRNADSTPSSSVVAEKPGAAALSNDTFVIDRSGTSLHSSSLTDIGTNSMVRNKRFQSSLPKQRDITLSGSIGCAANVSDVSVRPFDDSRTSRMPDVDIMPTLLAEIDEVAKSSVLTPDFEQHDVVESAFRSKRALKRQRKAEAEASAGKKWFDLPRTELTDERRRDLEVLNLREVLEKKKRFYRSLGRTGLPKYFQVGTVVDSPYDFYSSRVPRKERKSTIVDELLNDMDMKRKFKARYQQILMEQKSRKSRAAAGKYRVAGKRTKKT
ncbi:unnamed protein product [Soboliphyme baturini]|uniref:Fcf2 domain-containing protein n=1 Tax=Soboliphyme baturini TaxID=241478 RepID=A0A183I8V6_9BILA|nr:unnamed protein product [Soboliphyme baturini]